MLTESSFAAQVDDDSYVRVGQLLERIRMLPSAYAFMGYIENPGGHPHRDLKNKWYVSPEEWGKEKFPPWAHGAGESSKLKNLTFQHPAS